MPHACRLYLFDLLHKPHARRLQYGMSALRPNPLQRMRVVLTHEQPACRNPRIALWRQRISRRITKPRLASLQQQHQASHCVLPVRQGAPPQEKRIQMQSLPDSLVRCSMRQGVRITQLRRSSATIQNIRQRTTTSSTGMHGAPTSFAAHRTLHGQHGRAFPGRPGRCSTRGTHDSVARIPQNS